MLAFPTMIAKAADDAGMKVPPLDESDEFSNNDFPHFAVFCSLQLGRPMSPGAHWENAKVIAAIPEDQIREITFEQVEALGWII